MIRIDAKADRDLIGRIGLKLCGKPRAAHCMFLSSDSYTVLFHCAAPPRPACGKAQRDPVRPQPFLYCYSLQPFGHRRPSWAIAHTCTASRERNGCFHDAVKRCSATAWDGRAAPPSEPTAPGRCRCAMRRAASSLQVHLTAFVFVLGALLCATLKHEVVGKAVGAAECARGGRWRFVQVAAQREQ
jgi:hypothetical protein